MTLDNPICRLATGFTEVKSFLFQMTVSSRGTSIQVFQTQPLFLILPLIFHVFDKPQVSPTRERFEVQRGFRAGSGQKSKKRVRSSSSQAWAKGPWALLLYLWKPPAGEGKITEKRTLSQPKSSYPANPRISREHNQGQLSRDMYTK